MAATANCPASPAAIRGRWLVFTSLLLAFFIEVFPTEADLLFFPLMHREFAAAFAIKLVCLVLICTPVFIFFRLNRGRSQAVREVRVRLAIIAVILLANLAMNVMVLANMLIKSGST